MSIQNFDVKEHTIPAQHIRGYFKSTANSEEEELKLAVKQYIPRENKAPQQGDVTIIAAHAAGFCKEIYEPLFDDLYQESQKQDGDFRIRSIWIADICTHGQSGILNEGRLGIDLTWEDHARDLLQMTNIFRSSMPKPIIGLGHSMGANNIIQLALYHPRLFSGIICVEPVLNRDHQGMNFSPSYMLTERRDVWPSREAAIAENRKSGLVKTWDPRVVDQWDRYGFRELPTLLYPNAPNEVSEKAARNGTTPVTFTTTKHHDVRAFVRDCHPSPGEPLDNFQPSRVTHPDMSKNEHRRHQQPAYRPDAVLLFRQISFLRPPCLYIYGKKSTLFGSKPAGRAEKLALTGVDVGGSGGVKAGKVAEVVLEGAGHFAALEVPAQVARVAFPWMKTQVQSWREETALQAESWNRLATSEKAMVSNEWRWWVKEWYARKPKASGRRAGQENPSRARL